MSRRAIQSARALVTGASSGIGRELVRALARRGAEVLATARRAERLQALADEFAGTEHAIHTLAGDITDTAFRARLLSQAEAAWDGLDLLINNAGVGALGPFAGSESARLRHVMEVNFFAPAELIRAAVPLLRHGHSPLIVNIGSVLGHCAVPNKSEYCASKFALQGLTDALRGELARDGIALLLVSPSTTESEFFARAGTTAASASRSLGRPMPAARVAEHVVRGICRGRRAMVLSCGGKTLVTLNRLVPSLVRRVLDRWG